MKYTAFLLIAALFVGAAGCSDDDDDNPPTNQQPQEFVAQNSDFAGFKTWAQTISPQKGPDPAGKLFGAHASDDTTITRYITIKDASVARGSNGQYPNGTILVKEMRKMDGSTAAITAMVKRGGSFNPSHQGWEWFLLNPDGTISQRAADLMSNGCNNCHVAVQNKDYVFTK